MLLIYPPRWLRRFARWLFRIRAGSAAAAVWVLHTYPPTFFN